MLLVKATLSIDGDMDDEDFEAHEDEIEDTVENAMTAARNYIAAELGRLGIGPIKVTVDL